MSPSDAWYARRFDATYLELYRHRDLAEAETVVRHLIAPLGLAGRQVLDLACGAGRYVQALESHGARVAGVDLSAPLLEAARTAGIAASLGWVRADMRRLPFRDASFDLVMSMFTSFGYFDTEAEDRAVLREVGRVARTGASFVLDFLNAVRLRRDVETESQRRVGDVDIHERRRVDEAAGVVLKEIELRRGAERLRYREQVRLWEAEPLGIAIVSSGFDIVRLWGDYLGREFDAATSDRLIVHARRHRNDP